MEGDSFNMEDYKFDFFVLKHISLLVEHLRKGCKNHIEAHAIEEAEILGLPLIFDGLVASIQAACAIWKDPGGEEECALVLMLKEAEERFAQVEAKKAESAEQIPKLTTTRVAQA